MKKVAIIGAGPSGLPAIRHSILYGFVPTCFEATDDIGGLWRYKENERMVKKTFIASVMKTTVINTSKEMTAYSDFPPPPEFANFMHNTVLLEYFRKYVDHYGLLKYIKFKHYVLNVERTEDFEKTGKWKVTFLNDKNIEKSEIFDAVIIAVGHHAKPHIPDPWPGQNKFKGTILHSHEYKDHKNFEDKVTVVVGFGNSGGDVAVDLSRISKQVYLSSRRGVWLSYRLNEEGLPFDYIWSVRWFGWFRKLLPKDLLSKIVEKKLMNKFNLELYGMKPEHRFIATHPTQNDELPTRLANGTVIMKPAIRSFTENGVYFVDDSYVPHVDAVILCTGYSISFPMAEKGSLIPVENNKVSLYKYMYPPELSHKNTLAVVGLIQPLGSIMPIAEMQARVFFNVLSGKSKLPDKTGMLEDIKDKQEALKKRYLPSRRHTIQVDYLPFMDELSKLIDCTPTIWKVALKDPYLAWKLIWSPTPSYIYRIRGPYPWPGARRALLESGDRVKRGFDGAEIFDDYPHSLRRPKDFEWFVGFGLSHETHRGQHVTHRYGQICSIEPDYRGRYLASSSIDGGDSGGPCYSADRALIGIMVSSTTTNPRLGVSYDREIVEDEIVDASSNPADTWVSPGHFFAEAYKSYLVKQGILQVRAEKELGERKRKRRLIDTAQ
ncbi:hypothetical protein FO519_008043 [Halicephalobus sp. NKZ332]|nr:hypothetical protein FO519_008043 [Halicephalobus sp. NKZ332]